MPLIPSMPHLINLDVRPSSKTEIPKPSNSSMILLKLMLSGNNISMIDDLPAMTNLKTNMLDYNLLAEFSVLTNICSFLSKKIRIPRLEIWAIFPKNKTCESWRK